MSGTGRDHSGLEAGTTRSMSMGDPAGSADVHAGIAFNANADTDTGVTDRVTNRVKDVAGTVGDTASDLGHRARTLASDVAGRAGDLASSARDRVGALTDRATEALEQRGWLERLRENPLPALGVAFAAGFLLAGGGGGSGAGRNLQGGGSRAQRVRGELRGALMAGLSAGLAQGARAFLQNAGAGDGVINSVLQNLPGLGGDDGGGSQSSERSGGGRMAYSGGGRGPQSGSSYGGSSSYGGGSGGGRHREPSHRENL